MRAQIVVALTGLAALVAATPAIYAPKANVVHPRQGTPTGSLPPCAQVSVILEDYDKDGPVPTSVPAQIAYECVNSIPLNVTSAKGILWDLPIYVAWQSTLTVLKDPPQEYVDKVQPPVDILGGLEEISADIDAGVIKSEYQFAWRIYSLFGAAHDGHFAYIMDILGYAFQWGRTVPLVSVSEDGSKLPAVFAYYDVLGLHFKNISYTPSPIIAINDQEVDGFLEDLSQQGGLQDRDALFNNLFFSLAQASLSSAGSATGFFNGGGRGRYIYPGPTTTFEFANGTKYTIENYARTYFSFKNVTTGEDFAKKFIYSGGESQTQNSRPNLVEPSSRSASAASGSVGVAAPPPGYPKPIVPGPANIINGFYIDASGYEDVAVLQVPSFVGSGNLEAPFQATSQEFLARAANDGKTKLIIDLQANGGGTILQGYDLFKQLFPSLDPYGANRFRYSEAVDLIGQSFSAYGSKFPREEGLKNATLRYIQSSYFDYHTDMTVDAKPFESWAQKAGPNLVNGDNYTTLGRWNLSDTFIYFQSGINITGYGPASNVSFGERFQPENIVLVTDGYCASTCTLFSEFMIQQAGVKTIAFGGRTNAEPIQAVGGVKGANIYQWSFIQNYATDAIALASAERKEEYENSVLKEYKNLRVLNRAYAYGANVRDALRLGDDSGVPVQFKYDLADCRLYWTPEMTVDATAIWKAAADAQWGNSGKCIGSGGYQTPPPYPGKRAAQGVTTKLTGHAKMQGAQALRRYEALENTFSLETEYQPDMDGFMQP
ncbi:hypothetical protein N0V90_011129 [Kalmusia sp. IMI 367209]|nr:hypothetical protein N0V90_011129 [Kalmusia sp. IMI 367209]